MPRALCTAMTATLLLTVSFAASAQIYQWKDASGRTIISDKPPPANASEARTISSDKAPPPSPAASRSLAERELEFRKRQLDSREKEDKETNDSKQKAERKENCERARRQLALLESGERIVRRDTNGERRFIDDSERTQETETAKKNVSDWCK